MATSIWFRSGDTQIRKTIFEPAYSSVSATGATCEFFQGGTTTPWVVYGDSGANESLGSKITVDSNARWPSVFIVTGTPYKYIITDFTGEIIDSSDDVPNPDPAPEATPAPDLFQTGMTTWMQQDSTLIGWLRCNGGTMGSVASNGSESSSNDNENLFTSIWNNSTQETNPVSGGVRGASASADWLDNKNIQLPDMRSGGPLGLDGMGQPAGGFLASTPFTTGDAITPGSLAGYNSKTVAISEFEVHTHGTGTLVTAQDGDHTHGVGSYIVDASTGTHGHGVTEPNAGQGHRHAVDQYRVTDTAGEGGAVGVISSQAVQDVQSKYSVTAITINSTGSGHDHPLSGTSSTASPTTHNHTISGATEANGGTDAYNVVHRSVLGTWYIKQ